MSWSDWISVASSVVDIASQVADLVGRDDENDDQTPIMLGTVRFTSTEGTTIAENLDPNYGTLLAYSSTSPQPNGQIATVSQVQYLAPTQNPPPNTSTWYNCTSDINSFLPGGFLSVTGVASDETGNVLSSALSFALRAIAIGATINIIGGITASFGKDPQTGNYQFTIQSTGPKLQSASVQIKGSDGQSFKGQMTFNSGTANHVQDGTVGTIDLPPGLGLVPLVAALDLNLEIDEGTMQKLISG